MVTKMKSDGLVAHLNAWGLKTHEQPDWRHRGRPYNFYPRAIFCHHDASSTGSGNFGALGVVTYGRSDLPGPLSQFLLARDGTVVLVAAGYSNHAGYGGPRASVPRDQGNTYAIGIEAANNGIGEKWSAEQINAYYRLCAALMHWVGISDVNNVFGHKEWTSRKIDPAGIDMNYFRAQVKKAYDDGIKAEKVTVRVSKVQIGLKTPDSKRVKKRLRKRGFLKLTWGNKWTDSSASALARFQSKNNLPATGKADFKTLRALGFKVLK